jgi:hypothetical protein
MSRVGPFDLAPHAGALDRKLGQVCFDTAAFSVACSLVESVDRSLPTKRLRTCNESKQCLT